MNCKQVEKLVPFFLHDQLETDDLRNFMEHIDKCDACKEELTIEFLVSEGLARLESGSVFDLKRELELRIASAEHTLRIRENMKWLSYALDGMVLITTMVVIALAVILR